MKTVLLHTCCGPCGFSATKKLTADFDIKYFWYNPNIDTPEEHEKRLDVARKNFPLLVGEYNNGEWLVRTGKFAACRDKRCGECYLMRLTETAGKAKGLKIKYFSTTLLVSPYQNHGKLRETGLRLQDEFKINFLYYDGRADFYRNLNEFRKLGFYIQKYCGCAFGKNEK